MTHIWDDFILFVKLTLLFSLGFAHYNQLKGLHGQVCDSGVAMCEQLHLNVSHLAPEWRELYSPSNMFSSNILFITT